LLLALLKAEILWQNPRLRAHFCDFSQDWGRLQDLDPSDSGDRPKGSQRATYGPSLAGGLGNREPQSPQMVTFLSGSSRLCWWWSPARVPNGGNGKHLDEPSIHRCGLFDLGFSERVIFCEWTLLRWQVFRGCYNTFAIAITSMWMFPWHHIN